MTQARIFFSDFIMPKKKVYCEYMETIFFFDLAILILDEIIVNLAKPPLYILQEKGPFRPEGWQGRQKKKKY